jgi:hypothetical protein
MNKSSFEALLVTVLFFSASIAGAEGLDASGPLVCDLAQSTQCDTSANCKKVTLEQIHLPPVLHVDFSASQLTSPSGERRSPIFSVEVFEAVLVIQGHQDKRGWTMVIERATGQLSAAVADDEGTFVLAGACVKR